MLSLQPTLLDYDPGLVEIIAHRWDVDLASLDKRDAVERLAAVMLDPARAAAEWARLNDAERGALQTLLGAPDRKMAEAQFSRIFGEIRQMGPGRREREKPHLNPISIAETLYFRGLLATGFDQGKTGMQAFVYVPPDLAAVLPAHETGFDLEAEEPPPDAWQQPSRFEPDQVRAANTGLVDNMTTLLAHLQNEPVTTEAATQVAALHAALEPHWIGERHPAMTALAIHLAGSMGLVAADKGLFKPVPAHARHWLEDTRPAQVRALAEAWRNCTLFNDLWHTPGLRMEDTGWRNDPLLARQTVITYLEMAPPDDWWPVEELVELVHAEEPDFQRPAGDYDSWYIRDASTGTYLRGFDSWDRVDGAVLRFILADVMRWLGLMDTGDEGSLCRLTAYGRAFMGVAEWPDQAQESPLLTIETDGTILAPRTLNRFERFQLARITEWVAAGDPYRYAMTAAGLQRAAQQKLQPDAIRAFLRRVTGDAVPDSMQRLLQQWEDTGAADVWLQRSVILQTNSPEALQSIVDTPDLRRYLGAPLGPTAIIVRAGQEHDLAAALHRHGILVDFNE